MNHTERIAETARRHRHLNRRLVKVAVETYLELLAEEIAGGEWADIHGIGKIQVLVEEGSGTLFHGNIEKFQKPHIRLRTKIRLFSSFKNLRYRS